MAKGRLPLAVPKLTPYEDKHGELCALDLWDGIDYQNGKNITRDELFLTNFSRCMTARIELQREARRLTRPKLKTKKKP